MQDTSTLVDPYAECPAPWRHLSLRGWVGWGGAVPREDPARAWGCSGETKHIIPGPAAVRV